MKNMTELQDNIFKLERDYKLGVEIKPTDIETLEKDILESTEIKENQRNLLRKRFMRLKKKTLQIKTVTKWNLFVIDIQKMDVSNAVKDFVLAIDSKKNKTISREEVEALEKTFNNLLPDINNKMNTYDAERTITEIEKKIKLFKNRLDRVIETDFGSWIKQIRLKKGYSLKAVEEVSGVTASYIHRIENGSIKTPSVPIVKKLAIGLGVDEDEFFKKIIDENSTSIEEFKKPMEITECLKKNDLIVNNQEINTKQKSKLIDVIEFILNCDWTEKTKMNNSLIAIDKIEALKKALS